MVHHDIIGYIGCAFLFVSFIPQTYKLIQQNENIQQVSNIFIFFILCASFFMGIYAYEIKAYPVLIANISVFSVSYTHLTLPTSDLV